MRNTTLEVVKCDQCVGTGKIECISCEGKHEYDLCVCAGVCNPRSCFSETEICPNCDVNGDVRCEYCEGNGCVLRDARTGDDYASYEEAEYYGF